MSKTVNMAFIGTYPSVSQIFMEITSRMENIRAVNVNASFERAVEEALKREPELHVILSRGGTAEYIQRAVSIPVVYIPITPFDVVKVLHQIPPEVKSLAFIHYRKNIVNVREIEELYGLTIYEYLFTDYGEIAGSVRDASERGVEAVIGGDVAAQIAGQYGIKGYVCSAGYEAVAHAVEEALQILDEKEKEQQKSARITGAFSAMAEGILILDAEKRITSFNATAERVFRRHFSLDSFPGSDVVDPTCEKIYQDPLHAKKSQDIRKIGSAAYAVTHMPIRASGEFAGVVILYEDVTKVQKLEQQIRREITKKGFQAKHTFRDILGSSPAIRNAINIARLYSQVDSSVLIEGESGTGKEFFAQSIHNASGRKNGPFVAVNCTAIPENLLESELFGYEDGAFTGARKDGKPGLFEMAHGGTLFLDEIGEISESVQARLLRVLQEREVMRIGGEKVIPIDVRIISATNRNLWERSREGAFRTDLFYRLNVLHLSLPALRERQGDVAELSAMFAKQLGTELDDYYYHTILPRLEHYGWPGNVRELESVIERFSLLRTVWTDGSDAEQHIATLIGLPAGQSGPVLPEEPELEGDLREMTERYERSVIRRVLSQCGNDQAEAARRLGIGKVTLWRKLRCEENISD